MFRFHVKPRRRNTENLSDEAVVKFSHRGCNIYGHKHQKAEEKGLRVGSVSNFWYQFASVLSLFHSPRLILFSSGFKELNSPYQQLLTHMCVRWSIKFHHCHNGKDDEKMFQLDSIIDWWAVSVIPCTWLADCRSAGGEKCDNFSRETRDDFGFVVEWIDRVEGCEANDARVASS